MNALQESRLWLIGGAVATLVILLLGWLLLVSPQLTAASDIQDETASVETLNTTLVARIASLKKSESDLPELQADLAAGRLELPVRNDTQVFAESLKSAAEKYLVSVTSVSIGSPENVTTLAQGVVEAPVAAVAEDAADDAEVTAEQAAADAAAATAAAAAVRQTFALPVTFTAEGPAESLDSFIAELQVGGQRALSVTKIVVNPVAGIADGSIAGDVITSYSGSIYLSPLDAAAAAELFGTASGG